MTAKYAGSCLCGAVHFEVEGDFERFYLCHCAFCRKDTGSAHGTNLISSQADLTWISGQDSVRRFTLPTTRHSRSFCTTCGSALPYVVEAGGPLVVPAGSLNCDVPIRPNAHIFVASRANWDDGWEDVPETGRFPS